MRSRFCYRASSSGVLGSVPLPPTPAAAPSSFATCSSARCGRPVRRSCSGTGISTPTARTTRASPTGRPRCRAASPTPSATSSPWCRDPASSHRRLARRRRVVPAGPLQPPDDRPRAGPRPEWAVHGRAGRRRRGDGSPGADLPDRLRAARKPQAAAAPPRLHADGAIRPAATAPARDPVPHGPAHGHRPPPALRVPPARRLAGAPPDHHGAACERRRRAPAAAERSSTRLGSKEGDRRPRFARDGEGRNRTGGEPGGRAEGAGPGRALLAEGRRRRLLGGRT